MRETIADYAACLAGITFNVKDARISTCKSCGEIVITAEELKRWEGLQQADLERRAEIPAPDVVRSTREAFGLSIADFATLLGVTRQTVHSWERKKSKGMTLGPAAILVKSLHAEAVGQLQGLFAYLIARVGARGQRIRAARDSRGLHGGTLRPSAALRSCPGGCPNFRGTEPLAA